MFNFFKPKANAAQPRAHVTLSPREAHDRLANGQIHLVDVREAGEWAQVHVPGALHAPLSTLEQQAKTLPRDKPVVFMCLSGKRSARALDLCRQIGVPADAHVAGGISAWMASGLPVERRREKER